MYGRDWSRMRTLLRNIFIGIFQEISIRLAGGISGAPTRRRTRIEWFVISLR